MNNNQKKKIVGVAIISGVILVSITAGGIKISRNVRKRDEIDTIETQTQISAEATDFNATSGITKTIDGITYNLIDDAGSSSGNKAVVTKVTINSTSFAGSGIGTIGAQDGTLYINIPRSVTVNGTTYTIKEIGNGGESIFDFNGNRFENVVLIIPKNTKKILPRAIMDWSSGVTNELSVICLSNDIKVESPSSITNYSGRYLTIYGVEGSGIEKNLPSGSSVNFYPLYKTEKVTTGLKITGFNSVFSGVKQTAKIDIKFPEYIIDHGIKYPVTEIGANAFEGKDRINSIVLPATINKIGSRAFANDSISYVKFLNKDTIIDDKAFSSSTIKNVYGLTNSTAQAMRNKLGGIASTGWDATIWNNLIVSKIQIEQTPTKIAYKPGENVDLTGLVLKVTYDDGNNSYLIDPSNVGYTPGTISGSMSSSSWNSTIEVSYGGQRASYDVTVTKDNVPVTGVTMSSSYSGFVSGTPPHASVKVGETFKIDAIVAPWNATNKEVEWRTSNSSVATVDKTGNVTTKSKGSCYIIVETKDGRKSMGCNVTVTGNDTIEITDGMDILINYNEQINIKWGSASDNIIWTSNDTSVVNVFPMVGEATYKGVLLGLFDGISQHIPTKTTTVTATNETTHQTITFNVTCKGQQVPDKLEVNIEKADLYVGDSVKFTAKLVNKGSGDAIVYEVEDAQIVGEGEIYNNEIVGMGPGTTKVTIKSNLYPTIKKEISVTVKEFIHTVKLNDNGGYGGSSNIYFKKYDAYNASAYSDSLCEKQTSTIEIPSKKGYKFTGYYSEASGGTKYIDEKGQIETHYSDIMKERLLQMHIPDSNAHAQWKQITKVEIAANPATMTYKQGERLNLSEGKLKVSYEDGTSEDIKMTNYAVSYSNYNEETVGTQSVSIAYNGVNATTALNVEVTELAVTGITIANPKTSYIQGQDFDKSAGTITVSYENGTSKQINLTETGVEITNYDKTILGEQEVTVTYKGAQIKFKVNVRAPEITRNINNKSKNCI